LVWNGKKGKGNKSQTKLDYSRGGKNKGFSEIKCFKYNEFRHYVTKCPHKKSIKKNLGGGVVEALDSKFELEFTLIACMANLMMGSVWYLDSGASFHVMGCREFFNDLEEKYVQMHIDLGDDGRYNDTKIGTVTFKRKS